MNPKYLRAFPILSFLVTVHCSASTSQSGAGGALPTTNSSGPATSTTAGSSPSGTSTASSGSSPMGSSTSTAPGSSGTSTGSASGPVTTSTSATTSGTSTTTAVADAGGYALNPPNPCSNQFAVQSCTKGDTSSTCGGVCVNSYGATSSNVCESGKPGVPVNYICPRFMLFSNEMTLAAKDDNNTVFNYGVVGHDPNPGGVDPSGFSSSCCHCYQLVFAAGQQGMDPSIPMPPPMIVQFINTAAGGPNNFDIFMGVGGFGAFDGCAAVNGVNLSSSANPPMYTSFPPQGESCCGGVDVYNSFQSQCESNAMVTKQSLTSPACTSAIEAACNLATGSSDEVTTTTRNSCIASNQATSFYHQNFTVYAMGVECPTHLTEVTGCKLESSGEPQPDPTVTTAAQAAADSRFKSGYTTTTMQDCCMPTCAWSNNVTGASQSAGTAVGDYNSFYSCDINGVPWTE